VPDGVELLLAPAPHAASSPPRASPSAGPTTDEEVLMASSRVILVGVSGVTGSRAALQWAAQEARLRRGRVRAVMAWRGFGLPGGAPGRAPAQSIVDADPQQESAQRQLEEFVADALGDDHGAECRAVEGSAQSVLLQEAEEADLLVLDSPAVAKLYEPRGRRLAPQLIFRAPCPVVVMPALAHPDDDWEDWDATAGEYADQGEREPSGSSSP
jgi:nucleotide-binding universal stress UspA family protein